MNNIFQRTENLIGKENLDKLHSATVAVFGVGGVGSYAVEALARAGIGQLILVDNDTYSITNINRQLYATHSVIGEYKCEVAKRRISDINPDCVVKSYNVFFSPETSYEFEFSKYDYVVDAIDTVSGKIELILKCEEAKVPIISSMGAGNKLHPEMFDIADIYETSVCPLAKVIRQELKKRNIKNLKCVYSKETPIKQFNNNDSNGKYIPSSISFVPSAVGLIIAGEVVRNLINLK